jgi:hypothetical protein
MGQSNKLFYTILFIVVLSLISIVVYSQVPSSPNPGHSASVVVMTIDGQPVTLQDAVDEGIIETTLPGDNPPSSGGGSSSTTFFCQAQSTSACNLSQPFISVGKVIGGIQTSPGGEVTSITNHYLCCGMVDASLVETDEVTIGVDNNGGGSPDCWTETGGMLPSSCGSKQWSTSAHTAQWCVDQLLTYYNTLVPTQLGNPKKGGWVLEGWVDTGAASACLDGSSDQIKVRLARYSGS